jgi:hypothetical protein
MNAKYKKPIQPHRAFTRLPPAMPRLLRLLLGMVGMLCALSGAAIAVGRSQAGSMASLFTLPDGSACATICLFGIQPGLTSHTEALALLRTHPLTRHFVELETSGAIFSIASREVVVTLHSRPDRSIHEVLLFFVTTPDRYPSASFGRLALGDALTTLAYPTRISIDTNTLRTLANSRNFASWEYHSARLLITARLTDYHMSAITPIKHVQLSAANHSLGRFSPAAYSARMLTTYSTTQWLGFSTLLEYMRAALKSNSVRQSIY